MKYNTTNELAHFEFRDAHIAELQMTDGFFHILLDDVIILPENSCNRDIRKMRCNSMVLKITNGSVVSFVEEGCKIYNADGKLMDSLPDREVPLEEYADILQALADGSVYDIELLSEGGSCRYLLTLDATNDKTYDLTVEGQGDSEEWDRFLNLDTM